MDFEKIFEKKVIKALIESGAEVYVVGGAVRDFIMGKQPKDIDIIVRLLTITQIISVLEKTGKCDLVGESFGVVKYKEKDGFELDVALPRTDLVADGGSRGHKDILTSSNPFLSLEADLIRRDFRFNAIAIDKDWNFIDPFKGAEDIEKKLVTCVDKNAFVEDPLRILRAIQFAVRFGFSIEENTLDLIKQNAKLLKNISGERILMEFQKIASKKVSVFTLKEILKETCTGEILFTEYFTLDNPFNRKDFKIKTVSEIILAFLPHTVTFPKLIQIISEKWKLEVKIIKELKGFARFFSSAQNKIDLFEAINIAKSEDFILSPLLKDADGIAQFITKELPNSINDIAIDGNTLMEDFGLQGIEIGKTKRELLELILEGKLENKESVLFEFLKMAK